MQGEGFDRSRLEFLPVASRLSKLEIAEVAVGPETPVPDPGAAAEVLDRTAERILEARSRGAPVVICHGAHLVRNGLGPLLGEMVREGWLQHVATNGAGSIHDWEFAFLGCTCEDVESYVSKGQFGMWEETGAHIGRALLSGALDGLGYGESIGRMIVDERLGIPARDELLGIVEEGAGGGPGSASRAAAAADLLEAMESAGLEAGEVSLAHPHSSMSLQAACYHHGARFTVHPGIGQDIIYPHPLLSGGALGRASMTDFLLYADTISRLEGGVYLSVGSSVMSPMIFEKSLSMARNLACRAGGSLDDFLIVVNDLAESTWDWSKGEPPMDNPAYYVRFCKSFSRMGGELHYAGMDNRAFLLNLYQRLAAGA